MTEFTRGVELSRSYWHDVVRPVVDDAAPGLPRAAALMGWGSEVLGFDTARSTDHGWGPRLVVFVPDETAAADLSRVLEERVPDMFEGWPTRFPRRDDDPPSLQVEVTTVHEWFEEQLGFMPTLGMTPADWLACPSQRLREATQGEVFEDTLLELTMVRRRLAWYPRDVWLYLLGCQWRRLEQEEAFVGRCGEVGDEVGSAIVTARLVRDLMRMCFLIECAYAPYSKWLGSAFLQLRCAAALSPVLHRALSGEGWHEQERWLVPSFEAVARMFNELHIIPPLDTSVRSFHRRPFSVLGSGRFAEACMEATPLRRFGWAGSIDQLCDSTDVLAYPELFVRLRRALWDEVT